MANLLFSPSRIVWESKLIWNSSKEQHWKTWKLVSMDIWVSGTTCLRLFWFIYYHLTRNYRDFCFIQYCHRLLVITSWLCWLGDGTFQQGSYRILKIIFPEFSMISTHFSWVFSSKLICFSLNLLFVNNTRYECCAGGTTCNNLPAAGDLGMLWAPSRSRAEPWWGSKLQRPLKGF